MGPTSLVIKITRAHSASSCQSSFLFSVQRYNKFCTYANNFALLRQLNRKRSQSRTEKGERFDSVANSSFRKRGRWARSRRTGEWHKGAKPTIRTLGHAMVIRYARRMCAYMGNTVYAIRCVYLWIMVGGGHTAFGQFRSKSNKRPWRVPTHLMKRERKSSTNQPRTE